MKPSIRLRKTSFQGFSSIGWVNLLTVHVCSSLLTKFLVNRSVPHFFSGMQFLLADVLTKIFCWCKINAKYLLQTKHYLRFSVKPDKNISDNLKTTQS